MSIELKRRNKKIISLYENGVSQADIARLFNITRERVSQIIKEAEIKLAKDTVDKQ